MASSRFYLDTRKTPNAKTFVLKVAIQHKGKSALISLDARIEAAQWDSSKEKVINHPEKNVLNAYLYEFKQKVDSEIIFLTREGQIKEMSAVQIRDRILAQVNPQEEENKVDETLFLTRFLKFIEPKKASTKETYMHTLNRIRAFVGEDTLAKLHFEDITVDWLTSVNSFMAQTAPSPNGRNIHFRNLRAVFNNAIINDITTAYPFRKFKFKNVETAKRSLTVEELRRVLFFPCEEHQKKYRDMFRLMFYMMGVNMIDLANLKQMCGDRLEFNRAKTGHLYSMKVEPEAMELFERYKGKNYLLDILDKWSKDEFFR